MTEQGAEFLKRWIAQNITYLDQGGDYVRVMELANKCRETALALGIAVDEAESGIGVLETVIHKAMHGKVEF